MENGALALGIGAGISSLIGGGFGAGFLTASTTATSSFFSGTMGALTAWLGYNTCGAISPGNYLGNMAINTVTSQIMPPITIPIGDNFSLSVSPTFGLGTQGLIGGMNITGTYTNGDWSISGGFGGTDGGYTAFGGVSYYDRPHNQSFSYYATYFGGGKDNQTVGGIGYRRGDFSLRLENDFLAHSGDRWRTHAVEIGIGKFLIGTTLYTNDPKNEGLGEDCDGVNLRGIKNGHDNGAWVDGKVLLAPLYIGYKDGNNVVRIGYSSRWIQNSTQNWIHRNGFLGLPFGYQNYYTNYDQMKEGWYTYSGYYNPYTLY